MYMQALGKPGEQSGFPRDPACRMSQELPVPTSPASQWVPAQTGGLPVGADLNKHTKAQCIAQKNNFNTVTNVFLPSTTKFTERKVDKKEQNAGRFSIWRAGVRAVLIDCWDFFITSEIMLSLWDVVE